jgi:hypothetical protein
MVKLRVLIASVQSLVRAALCRQTTSHRAIITKQRRTTGRDVDCAEN